MRRKGAQDCEHGCEREDMGLHSFMADSGRNR